MRFLTSLPVWALVSIAASGLVGAASLESRECVSELCVGGQIPEDIVARAMEPTPVFARKPMTNAERLARGLTPNPPTRRHHVSRQQPSAVPQVTYTGKIRVRKQENNEDQGFLSTVTTPGGNIKWTTTESEILKVSVALDEGANGGDGVRVNMLNGVGPLLGLVEGRDNTNPDISSTSFHYLYLNGVALPGSSGPFATPEVQSSVFSRYNSVSKTAETDLWTIDVATGTMSPQWINTDGSAPTTILFSQSGYIYGGGSPELFQGRYPSAVTPLYLEFVRDIETQEPI